MSVYTPPNIYDLDGTSGNKFTQSNMSSDVKNEIIAVSDASNVYGLNVFLFADDAFTEWRKVAKTFDVKYSLIGATQ